MGLSLPVCICRGCRRERAAYRDARSRSPASIVTTQPQGDFAHVPIHHDGRSRWHAHGRAAFGLRRRQRGRPRGRAAAGPGLPRLQAHRPAPRRRRHRHRDPRGAGRIARRLHRARQDRFVAPVHHQLGGGAARARRVERQDAHRGRRRAGRFHPHRRSVLSKPGRPLGRPLCAHELGFGPPEPRLRMGQGRRGAAQPCLRRQPLRAGRGDRHRHQLLRQGAHQALPPGPFQRRPLGADLHAEIPAGLRRRGRHGAGHRAAGPPGEPGPQRDPPHLPGPRQLAQPRQDRSLRQGRDRRLRCAGWSQGRHHR